MYACAKTSGCVSRRVLTLYTWLLIFRLPYRKNIIRGATTNGCTWLFLILYVNSDGKGATYKTSAPVYINVLDSPNDRPDVEKEAPDVIAGILSSWVSSIRPLLVSRTHCAYRQGQVEKCFEDIGEDDWYEDRG